MKTGVLILLVSLLCAEKGEMEKGLGVEGTLAFSLCAQCLRCTGVMGVPCVGWLVVGELSCAGVASWASKLPCSFCHVLVGSWMSVSCGPTLLRTHRLRITAPSIPLLFLS